MNRDEIRRQRDGHRYRITAAGVLAVEEERK